MNFLEEFLREVRATVTDSETPYVFKFSKETDRLLFTIVDESKSGIREFVQDIKDYVASPNV